MKNQEQVPIRPWAFAIAILLLCSAPAQAAQDYIIHNAKIVTVDGKFSIAEAAAISGSRFLAVGSNQEILSSAAAGTPRIDMQGRTILPGMTDSHQGLISKSKNYDISVDLTNVRSIADIQQAIAAKAKTTKKGDWIIGTRGWWEYQLAENRVPTRFELDQAAPDHPVSIPGPHYHIANSRALTLAGISRDTKNPPGGEIWHDEKTGEPHGLLMDRAGRMVTKLHPKANNAQQISGVRKLLARAASNGVTSVGETGGSIEDAQLLRTLHDAGQLTLRFDFGYGVDPTLPIEQIEAELVKIGPPGRTFGDGMFRSDTLSETSLDGAELTAFLRDDYPTRPNYRGLQIVPQEQFNKVAALANRYGWRLRPHAVGDAAIDEALDAFEYADRLKPLTNRRWMIDHAFLLRPDHYPRVKKLGLIINSQYMHNYQLGALILKAWGRPLADMSERYRDWTENGIMFANGSDGPISYHSEPLLMIYGSVTRKTAWGGTLGPDQGLSREAAIRSVTINSAHTTFEEHVKGSIEPGKYADFVVLSDDILAVPADAIKDIKVLTTVLGGKPVFGSLGDLRLAAATVDSAEQAE